MTRLFFTIKNLKPIAINVICDTCGSDEKRCYHIRKSMLFYFCKLPKPLLSKLPKPLLSKLPKPLLPQFPSNNIK
jgi:hypothetical protein